MRELRLDGDPEAPAPAPGAVSLPFRDEPREVTDARAVIAMTTMMLDQHVRPDSPERPGMCRDLARAHSILAAHYRREANP